MKLIRLSFAFALALGARAGAAEWTEWDAHEGGSHYYTVTSGEANWFESQAEAESLGGYLTTIGSLQELDFIRSAFGRTELFWTGLSTVNDGNGGSFEWVNGDPVTYTYFSWHTPDPTRDTAVIINQPNSRGFTRGFFYDVSPYELHRGIVESDSIPTANVPDAGSTLILLALAGFVTGWARRRSGQI